MNKYDRFYCVLKLSMLLMNINDACRISTCAQNCNTISLTVYCTYSTQRNTELMFFQAMHSFQRKQRHKENFLFDFIL